MKFVLIFLLLAISCVFTVRAQAVPDKKAENATAIQAKLKPALQLSTSIVEQKYYCRNYVGLKLRLTFKNIGSLPIILDKRSFIVRVMVSSDLEAANAQQYEVERRADYFDAGSYFITAPLDMTNFIIIKPGEAYTFDDGVGSFSVYDGASELTKDYIRVGTHLLQVEASTWSYITDPKLFHQEWKRKGYLWSEGLISLPMPFTIVKDHLTPKCP